MTLRDDVMAHAQAQPAAELTHPFGEYSACWKVGGKIFCLVNLVAEPGHMSIKGDPDDVAALRQAYPGVTKAPYLSVVHWALVPLDGGVPRAALLELVDDAYDVVRSSLTKKVRDAL